MMVAVMPVALISQPRDQSALAPTAHERIDAGRVSGEGDQGSPIPDLPSQSSQATPSRVYVSTLFAGTVAVIDAGTDTLVGDPIGIGGNPCGIAVTPDGSKVYVSIRNLRDLGAANEVAVINAATREVSRVMVGRDPHGIAVTPDGKLAYVANYFMDDSLSVIDTATDMVIKNIPVGSVPAGVIVSHDGQRVYVADASTHEDQPPQPGTVSVVETPINRVVARIAVGRQPVGVAISPDDSKLYVTNFGDNTVSVIDTNSNMVIDTIAVGRGPGDLKVLPTGARVYVADTGNFNRLSAGKVSVIDATSTPMKVIKTIRVGPNPIGVGITPDGLKIYVGNTRSGSVSVIDTTTNKVLKTIRGVGLGACGVAVGPAPAGA
jgi:YVTN family beta-propeller protein